MNKSHRTVENQIKDIIKYVYENSIEGSFATAFFIYLNHDEWNPILTSFGLMGKDDWDLKIYWLGYCYSKGIAVEF